ncbi:MAG TPA: glycosyltransferase [Thermoanaerobaculia bacterium]|nr:glycosyltransferase [Thermoanaerobaculia bacterium]
MNPRVSIVLPFRNEERFLEDSLKTILEQSIGEWELHAIDDHSTDRSASILRDAAAADRRIKLASNPGRGLVAALQHGFARARAPLVARMDADDLMTPDRLEVQTRALAEYPETALVASRVRIFPRNLLGTGYREYERWQNAIITPEQIGFEIFHESPFTHPTVMFRREMFNAIGGYRDGAFPEDYELWLRIYAQGLEMRKCEEVLLHWRERPDRTSRIDPRYSREAFDLLRARHLARDPRITGSRPLVIWGAGRRTRQRARHFLELSPPIESWIDVDPRKIGREAGGIPVHAPEWLASRKPRPFVLVYVRNYGARELIAPRLASMGYEPIQDWIPVG